jgi:hypothetical protein
MEINSLTLECSILRLCKYFIDWVGFEQGLRIARMLIGMFLRMIHSS